MSSLLRDFRYGIRTLLKQPSFTIAAVLTLALGIGANTAIFSLVSTLVLNPLPYKDPERLVIIWESNPSEGIARRGATPANFVDWTRFSTSFEGLAALNYRDHEFTLTGEDRPERVSGGRVSASLFPLLGVTPHLGRLLLAEDEKPGAAKVVLLGHELWERRFGKDPGIIGRRIRVSGASHEVIGVLPKGFSFFQRENELWTTLGLTPEEMSNRSWWFLRVFGRLKPGVTAEQAQAEMDAVARRLEQEHPTTNRGCRIGAIPLGDWYAEPVRPMLFLLFALAGVVQLVACGNVVNLVLARSIERQDETALRTALGASRFRLIRQFLTEAGLLALLGAVAGSILALWCVHLLVNLLPENLLNQLTSLNPEQLGLNRSVLLFLVVITIISVLLFGLIPGLIGSGHVVSRAARNASAGRAKELARRALVTGELAMAVILVAASLVLYQSFQALSEVELGFRPSNILTFEVDNQEPGSEGNPALYYEEILERVGGLQGVRSAAAALILPTTGARWSNGFLIEGRPQPRDVMPPLALYRIVSPGYFRTLDIPLKAGRLFYSADGSDAPGVVIINQAMADKFWPDENPVGKRLRLSFSDSPWLTVVGIAGNVRYVGLQQEPEPVIYRPYTQHPISTMKFLLRTDGDPRLLVPGVRSAVMALNPDQAIGSIQTMDDVVDRSLAEPRLLAYLGIGFAGVAGVLALIGVFGVTVYYVRRHTREIGIHMALGAERAHILRQILRQGLILTALGTAAGLLISFLAADALTDFLFRVRPREPLNFVLVGAFALFAGMAATYIAGRRATRIEPGQALRYE